MSAYKIIQTEYRNIESLKKALTDVLGVGNFDLATSHTQNTLELYDWHGLVRPERVSVRIARKVVNKFSSGASNDVGFSWNGKGFDAIVSEYDQSTYGCTDMLKQIKQKYAYHELTRLARAKGYTVRQQKSKSDGVIRMKLVKM